MADLPCRFDAHVALMTWIAGDPIDVPVCAEPARHREIAAFEPVPGVTLQIDTDVCDKHLADLARSGFHKRSARSSSAEKGHRA